jgi:hypothetical protein
MIPVVTPSVFDRALRGQLLNMAIGRPSDVNMANGWPSVGIGAWYVVRLSEKTFYLSIYFVTAV